MEEVPCTAPGTSHSNCFQMKNWGKEKQWVAPVTRYLRLHTKAIFKGLTLGIQSPLSLLPHPHLYKALISA